jgi:hypothetical protein
MRRRVAQVTAFMITGIVILAIVAIAILLRQRIFGDVLSPDLNDALQAQRLESAFDECVDKVSADGLKYVASNGWFYEVPNSIRVNDSTLWIAKTISIFPTNSRFIEQNVERYIQDSFESCIPFEEYEKRGWTFSSKTPIAFVNVRNGSYDVKVEYNITARIDNFEKKFNDGNYRSEVDVEKLFLRAADFVNSQLLSPAFDFTKPLEGYNSGGDRITYSQLNETTLRFTITDGSGKLVGAESLALSFAANFEHNDLIRIYERGSMVLISPDRLATLIFPNGAPSDISIRQYEADSVTRYQMPISKWGDDVLERGDVVFPTEFPIYRFGPNGLNFSDNPAILTIFLNKDQKQLPSELGFLLNGKDGWIPFPHNYDSNLGVISTMMFGFTEVAPVSCEGVPEKLITVGGTWRRAWYSVFPSWVSIIVLIVAVALAVFTGGGSLFSLFTLGGTFTTSMLFVPTITEIIVIAGAAYWAYSANSMSAKDTLVISSPCGGSVEFFILEKDGKCRATIVSTSSGTPKSIKNRESYYLSAGESVTVTATLKEMDDWKTSARCQVVAKGKIVTGGSAAMEGATEAVETPLEEPTEVVAEMPEVIYASSVPGNSSLGDANVVYNASVTINGSTTITGCCANTVCAENQPEASCLAQNGTFFARLCTEVQSCPQYGGYNNGTIIDSNNSLCSSFGPYNDTLQNVVVLPYNFGALPPFEANATYVMTRMLSNNQIPSRNYFMYKKLMNTPHSHQIEEPNILLACGISAGTYVYLDATIDYCTHTDVVKVNPMFVFKPTVSNIFSNFCSNINVINFNPPVVAMTPLNSPINASQDFVVSFSVNDIQYPVEYAVMVGNDYGFQTKDPEKVYSNSSQTAGLNIGTPGVWNVTIQATNIWGIRGFSLGQLVEVHGIRLYSKAIDLESSPKTIDMLNNLEIFPPPASFVWNISGTGSCATAAIDSSGTVTLTPTNPIVSPCSETFLVSYNDTSFNRYATTNLVVSN